MRRRSWLHWPLDWITKVNLLRRWPSHFSFILFGLDWLLIGCLLVGCNVSLLQALGCFVLSLKKISLQSSGWTSMLCWLRNKKQVEWNRGIRGDPDFKPELKKFFWCELSRHFLGILSEGSWETRGSQQFSDIYKAEMYLLTAGGKKQNMWVFFKGMEKENRKGGSQKQSEMK